MHVPPAAKRHVTPHHAWRSQVLGEPELQDVEAFAARLYTGPLFVKYNAVLRGIKSDVPVLRRQMLELCCARADFEAFTSSVDPLTPRTAGAHNLVAYEVVDPSLLLAQAQTRTRDRRRTRD